MRIVLNFVCERLKTDGLIESFITIAGFLFIVPKEQYKKTLIYGLLFGGLGDTLVAGILTYLGLISYKSMGAFNILNIFHIWTPIAWGFAFGVFFYLLLLRRAFQIPYLILFTGFSYGVGLVLQAYIPRGPEISRSCSVFCMVCPVSVEYLRNEQPVSTQ